MGYGWLWPRDKRQPRGFGVRDVNTAATPAAITVDGKPVSDWFKAQTGNQLLATRNGLGLNTAIFDAVPVLTLTSSGTLATGGIAPTGSFFTAAAFIGAFGTTDWTAKWANFSPSTADYTK
ncbi:MAG: hypothetical protein R2822_17050 [Spirosomataceae bacterium]